MAKMTTRELESAILAAGCGAVRVAVKGRSYRLVAKAAACNFEAMAAVLGEAGFVSAAVSPFTSARLGSAALNGGAFLYHRDELKLVK